MAVDTKRPRKHVFKRLFSRYEHDGILYGKRLRRGTGEPPMAPAESRTSIEPLRLLESQEEFFRHSRAATK